MSNRSRMDLTESNICPDTYVVRRMRIRQYGFFCCCGQPNTYPDVLVSSIFVAIYSLIPLVILKILYIVEYFSSGNAKAV